MSNDYKIEVGDTLAIYNEADKDSDMCMLKVESHCVDSVTCTIINGELKTDVTGSYYVLDKYRGKTAVDGISDVSMGEEGRKITINLTGETEYPNDVTTTDDSYMVYKCPTEVEVNTFLTESGSKLTHVPVGDSIYGLFFALFREQEKRISELEKALIGVGNTNTSH